MTSLKKGRGRVEVILLLSALAACSPDRTSRPPVSDTESTPAAAAEPTPRPEPGGASSSRQPSPPEPTAVTRALPPAQEAHSPGGKIVPPKVLHRIMPDLQWLGDRRVAGTPIVEALVGADGRVKDVRVVRGVNSKIDTEIVEALKKWRFQPATLEGKPVSAHFTVTVSIDLQ